MNDIQLSFETRIQLAKDSQAAGYLRLAVLDYRTAWALRPEDTEVPLALAEALRMVGEVGEAIATLQDALERNPDHYAAHYQLAQLYFKHGEYAGSLAHYQQALRLKPGNASILSSIAQTHIRLGQHEEARVILAGLIEKKPEWDRPYRYLASIAQTEGRREEAVQHLRLALKCQPDDEALVISLATGLRDLGRLDEAEACLNGLDRPDSGPLWYQRGLLAQYRNDTEEALCCFRAGQCGEPTHPACYQGLLAEYLRLGLLEEAETLLAAARQCLAEAWRIDHLAIRVLRARGRYEDAVALAATLVEEHPESSPGWEALTELHISLGQLSAAENLLSRMPTPQPAQAQSQALLRSRLAQARYDVDGALAWLDEAAMRAPVTTGLLQQKAILELMRGDGQAARETLLERRKLLDRHGSSRIRSSGQGGLLHHLMCELRMNPFAQEGLAKAHRLPREEQLPALATLLTEEPDYPGTAVTLLLALRRQGGLATRTPGPDSEPSRIPRFVVQFWDSARTPDDILGHLQSWSEANPGFQHRVFNDNSAEAFIAEHCEAEVLTAFRMAGFPFLRADLFRLAFLCVHGGIYADADDHCRHDLSPWLKPGVQLLLYQEEWGTLGNNFLAAAPNHPFLRRALAFATDSILNRQGGVRLVSGPGALTTVFCNLYVAALAQGQLPPGIEILDVYTLRQRISPHLPRAWKLEDQPWHKPPVAWKPVFHPPRPYLTATEHDPLRASP